MKLPARFQHLMFAIFMGTLMSFLMSAVITFFNLGAVEGFFGLWMKAWGAAIVVAIPVAFFVGPIARKLVSKFVEQPA
jgi:tetrahydromethanopterin S-methyltransferase subunit D